MFARRLVFGIVAANKMDPGVEVGMFQGVNIGVDCQVAGVPARFVFGVEVKATPEVAQHLENPILHRG